MEFAKAETQKRAPHLTHPLLCLDAIRVGVEQGGHAGLKQESAAFAQAASLDTHKALVHIFFAQRATKKVSSRSSVLLQVTLMSSTCASGVIARVIAK